MKRRSRILAWLLAIVMLMTSMPSSSFASGMTPDSTGALEESQTDVDETRGTDVTESSAESFAQSQSVPQSQDTSQGDPVVQSTEQEDATGQSAGEIESQSQTPGDESAEPVTQESVPARSAQDLTGNAQALELILERAIYTGENARSVKVDRDALSSRLDLSALSVKDNAALTLSFHFQLFPEQMEGGIVKGDTFYFMIPAEWFDVKDTLEPVSVYNCQPSDHEVDTQTRVGQYEIHDHRVTVTMDEAVETAGSVMGNLRLNAAIRTEKLSETETTAVAMTDVKTTVILPAMAGSDAQEESAESGQTSETWETPAVTDETPSETGATPAETDETPSETGEIPPAATDETEETLAESDESQEMPEDTDRSNVLTRFRALMSSATVASGSTESSSGGALVTKYTYNSAVLPEGFDEIQLTVSSREGGYANTNPEDANRVLLAYKAFMDESVLYGKSEEMINDSTFPIDNGGDFNQWLNDVWDWINVRLNAGTETYITYTFDLGEKFEGITTEAYKLTISDYGDISVGTYGIENGSVFLKINPICCFMDNVFFEFGMDVQINGEKLTENPQEVIINDKGELVFQSVGTAGGGDQKPEDIKYTVTKEAPVRVTQTSIDYNVSVAAVKEGERLNGLTLKDVVPEGLQVETVKVRLNGAGDFIQLTEADTALSADKASYTFAAYDEADPESAITKAEFIFGMKLTDEKYAEYIKAGINQTFTNKAALYDKEPGQPLAESEDVPTKMTARFIEKSGKAQNLEGTRYAWNVKLQTHLPTMANGYLVDTLCWTDHKYDFDKGIEISVDGGNPIVIKTVTKLDTAPGTWNDLTAQKIETAIGRSEFNSTAYYYFVDETDASGQKVANPFYTVGGTEPEYKQRAILIIPYLGLQGTSAPKSVTVKYFTDLNLHQMEPQAYWEQLQNSNYEPVIANNVNLLWYNTDGVGPGPAPQDSVDFGKEVEAQPGAVSKKGLRYDEKTQLLTWSIDVNKLGIDMKNVKLTDVLPTNIFAVPDDLLISWYKYSHNGQKLEDSGTVGNSGAPSYALSDDNGNKVLTIDLGDVDGYIYTLTFAVKLVDTSILSQQKNASVSNRIHISYDTPDGPRAYDTSGTMPVTNTLIDKTADGDYDYDTFELPWKVTINPNSLQIENAVFGDTVMSGFDFGRITKVEYDGVEDTSKLDDLKGQISKTGFNTQAPALTLGNIDKPYTIYFTTVASEKWRGDNMKVPDGNVKTLNIPNTATLKGRLGSDTIDASDDAANVIYVNPIGKYGIYDKDNGSIQWTLDINQAHYDMAGMKLEEVLTAAGEIPIHELDPDSIKVTRISHENGTATEVDAAGEYELSDCSFNAFYCTFKAGSDGKNENTYRIQFTTYLTSDAGGHTIMNRVFLKDASGNDADSSGTSDGGYHGDFDVDHNHGAQTRPRVLLKKISDNSTDKDTPADHNSVGLNGAQFELEAHTFTYDPTTQKLTIDAKVQQYSKARYTNDGEIYFTNLKTSTTPNGANDLICVIKEITPAAGYQNLEQPRFVYFATEGGNLINQGGQTGAVTTIMMDNMSYGGELYQFSLIPKQNNGSIGTFEPATVVFQNKPVETVFTFTKKEVKLESYIDQGQTPTMAYQLASDVAFELEPVGDLEGHVELPASLKKITTDAQGQATLSGLDPGKYRLTEVKANTGLKTGGTVILTVAWDSTAGGGAGSYVYIFSDAKGGLTIDKDGTTLLNSLDTVDVSFKKYAGYQDGKDAEVVENNREPLSGATFRIESVTPDTGNVGVTAGYIAKTVISDANGKVQFNNLPIGKYAIYEVYGDKKVPGYVGLGSEEKVYDLIITQQADGTGKVSITKTLTPARTATAAQTQDTKDNCYNEPMKGTITFKKTIDGGDLTAFTGKALADAQFGLFRKIGGKAAAEPVYTASSAADGTVTFAQVEYGDYILKEVKAPNGYLPMKDVEIKKADFTISTDGQSFSYEKTSSGNTDNDLTTAAVNQLYMAQATLLKKDIDGGAMAGVTFDVYRRGSVAINEDGSIDNAQTPFTMEATGNTYYPYKPSATASAADGTVTTGTVTTDANGRIALTKLPYGDYLLVEASGDLNLQDDHNKVAVHISVGRDGDGAYTTAVKVNENASLGVSGDGYTLSGSLDTDGWKVADQTDGSHIVVNHKKYGYVNLNKTDVEGRPLSGGVFEIYRRDSNGQESPYLTLTTNMAGQFDIVTEGAGKGAYIDKDGTLKHLWYGEYTIKEITPPAGHRLSADAAKREIDFTIGEGQGLGGHEGTAWIQYKDESINVAYTAAGADAPKDTCFVNKPIILQLYKTDESAQPLSGTSLRITPADARDAFADGTKEINVTTDDVGKVVLTGKLIAGHSYVLTEVNATPGYQTPITNTTKLSVSDDGTTLSLDANNLAAELTKSGEDAVLTIKNKQTSLTIAKVDDSQNPLAGADLALFACDKDLNISGEAIKTWTSQQEKPVTFTGIPEGTYVLMETGRPSGYLKADPIYFTLSAGNVVTLINGPEAGENTRPNGAVDGSIITMTDVKILQDIILHKTYKNTDKPIAGVVFDLYDNNKTDDKDTPEDERIIGSKITDAQGNLTFTDVPEGSYTIKENLTGSLAASFDGAPKTPVSDDVYMDTAWSMTVDITVDAAEQTTVVKVDGKAFTDTVIEVTNDEFTADVTMAKVDPEDGTALEGVTFLLEKKDGETYKPYNITSKTVGSGDSTDPADTTGRYATDGTGLHLVGLTRGDYRLTEIKTIDGYVLEKDNAFTATFTVSNDNHNNTLAHNNALAINKRSAESHLWNLQVTKGSQLLNDQGLTNTRATGTLTLKKVDSKDDTGLDGVEFELTKEKPAGGLEQIWNFITGKKYESVADLYGEALDKAGVLTIHGLEWGNYKLVETKPLDGYALDTKVYEFTIGPNNTEMILSVDQGIITNAPIEMTIQKLGMNGKSINGAEFTLTRIGENTEEKSGEAPIIAAITKEGQIKLSKALVGGNSYMVSETVVPAGYKRVSDFKISVSELGEVSLDNNAAGAVTVENNVLTVTNDPIILGFIKTGVNGDLLSDVQFTISGDFAEWDQNGDITAKAGQLTVDADGKLAEVLTGRLIAGKTYMVTESKIPEGYTQVDPFQLTVNADGTATVKDSSGNAGTPAVSESVSYDSTKALMTVADTQTRITLAKKSGADFLKGTKFTLKPSEGSHFAGGATAKKAVETGDDGRLAFVGILVAGNTYELTETKAADGYVTPVAGHAKTVFKLSDDGRTITFVENENSLNAKLTTDENGLIVSNEKTTLTVAKVDDSPKPLAGASLALYACDKDLKPSDKAIKTWRSEAVPMTFTGEIPEGTYVLMETDRPAGYLKADPIYFTLSAGNVVTLINGPEAGETTTPNGAVDGSVITMTDVKILQDITLHKTYKNTDKPIAGVVFDLYDNNKTDDKDTPEDERIIRSEITDDEGHLTFTDVSEGSYTIKENLTGSLAASFDGSPKTPVSDDVYIDTAWSVDVDITVDAAEKTTVVKVDGKVFTDTAIEVTNDEFTSDVTMAKVDPEDGTALEGVTFLLEKKDGETYKLYDITSKTFVTGESTDPVGTIGRYTTDDQGLLHLDGLTRGDYRLTEYETIYGYVLDPQQTFIATFTVTNEEQNDTLVINSDSAKNAVWQLEVPSGGQLLTAEGLTNIRDTGSVTLHKADSASKEGLNGVSFELYMKKDGNWLEDTWNFITGRQYESIGDVDGEVLDTDGTLTISGLSWGEYKLVEKRPLDGYITDTAEHIFYVGREETDVHLSVTLDTIYNTLNAFTLEKRGSDLSPDGGQTGEDTDLPDGGQVGADTDLPDGGQAGADANLPGDGNLLDGAVFTLTNIRDASDSHQVTVDGGRVVLAGLLTGGETYILHEETAPVGYQVNPSSEDVTLTMGTDGVVTVDGKALPGNVLTIMNHPTRLSFTKVGRYNEDCADGQLGGIHADAVKPLAGVEFTAYAVDHPEVAAATAVSNADGTVLFTKLPLGRYYIKETKTPSGYKPNTETYVADVISGTFKGLRDEKGEFLKDNTIVNDVYRTDIQMTKVNEKNPQEVLAGSEYGLYRKVSGDQTERRQKFMRASVADFAQETMADTTDGWQLIATSVTDANGLLKFEGVLMDTEYMIRELKAPDGSYVSEQPIKLTFTIDENGETKLTTFDDGKGTAHIDEETGEIVWYEPPVEVDFIKLDDLGQPLAGATLQVQHADGTVIEEWTSTAQAHRISSTLVIGETYRLVEVKAPDGFSMAAPVEFTVDDGPVGAGEDKLISVTMKDAPIVLDVVKTDKEDGKVLTGAEFAIRGTFADGSSVKTVKPEGDGARLRALLIGGNSYELTETKAPEGYEKLSDTIRFNVDVNGNVTLATASETAGITRADDGTQVLTIANAKVIVPPESETETEKQTETQKQTETETETQKQTESETKKPTDGVKTGDATPVAPLAAVSVISLGVAIMALAQRKRKKKG